MPVYIIDYLLVFLILIFHKNIFLYKKYVVYLQKKEEYEYYLW